MAPPRISVAALEQPAYAVTHTIDARWLMAFAAGLDDHNPALFDTRVGVTAHPLFPVSLEWPAVLALRQGPALGIDASCRGRGVHAEHDLHLFRPLRAGQIVTSTARAVALQQRPPGALLTTCIDTHDAAGNLLCQTWHGTLFRGVDCAQPDVIREAPPERPPLETSPARYLPLEIPLGAAHRYTECARIYNPIHTDIAVAEAAGLPGTILHGTATLGRALSRMVGACLDEDGSRVQRIACRFSGTVRMPETLVLRVSEPQDQHFAFSVWSSTGQEVLRHGLVSFAAVPQSIRGEHRE
jgi:acyl dehydratase